MTRSVYQHLTEKISPKNIIKNCDMGACSSFKAGGMVDIMIIPEDMEGLRYTLKTLAGSGLDYMVIGNGTNILVSDHGYKGAIVKLSGALSEIKVNGVELKAGAGAALPAVAKAAMEAGLTGLEFASGIPGSLGGAVFMNAGAYGGEMKDIIRRVELISKDGCKEYELSPSDMKFSYRYSVAQDNDNIIITGATIRLKKGNIKEIRERIAEFTRQRNMKQPVSLPSAGSFFKRPEGYFAGKLIEDAGLMGLTVGGAMVSSLHAGFLVNNGGATATDITDLMRLVQYTVDDKFGVWLKPEVRIIGEL